MVKKRGEVYYLRLHVPKDVQFATGSKEIVKSLGTGRAKEAKSIANTIKFSAETIWKQVRLMKQQLSTDKIKAMVKQWFDNELKQYADPMSAPRWLTDHQPHEFEFFIDELSSQKKRLQHIAKFPPHKYEATDDMLAIGAPEEGEELQACQEIVNHLLESHSISEVDSDSQFYLMRHVALALSKINAAQRHAALSVVTPNAVQLVTPTQSQQSGSDGGQAILLSEALRLRLEEMKAFKRAPTTIVKYQGQARILLKLLNDKPVDQYQRADFIEAQKILNIFPRNANTKAPDDSIESILSRTDLGEPLTTQTVFGYLILIASIFKFCVASGWIKSSPVPKWERPEEDNEGSRPAFNDEQLSLLFSSPHYKNKAVRIKAPHNYWIILIALFTGMRLNEVCQLYLSDIREVDNILCFNINREANKRTKNKSSVRLVPVHSTLLKIGLDKYVNKLKSEGAERLFPQLTAGGRGYSTNFGKNINKYLHRHVTEGLTKEERPTFHSLRSNFSEALTAHGLPFDITAALLGHAPAQKITVKHYAGTYPPAVLQNAVESIDFPAVHQLF